jgi:hypothetical protein
VSAEDDSERFCRIPSSKGLTRRDPSQSRCPVQQNKLAVTSYRHAPRIAPISTSATVRYPPLTIT